MFTPDEIANINNSTLENFIDKGTVWSQNIANKPMLKAFNAAAGKFTGGKENVSLAVKSGQGGGSLNGYTGDDSVAYYNPTGTKRVRYPWKEHHIGITIAYTELTTDGIEVVEDGADQSTVEIDGREEFALANLLDEKHEDLGEDFAFGLDRLIHGDGTADAKALAGIGAFILDSPGVGATGGLSRTNAWWRNRAATAANGSAGGQGAITSATTNGGALIEFMEKDWLLLNKYRKGSTKLKLFCGSDFRAAYLKEQRANGYYTQNGWRGKAPDAAMDDPLWHGLPMTWDPTMDDLGLSKRLYILDISRTGLQLLYLNGKRMQKHNPARPYDRYVLYNGITTTAVLVAKQLNTSAVYDIT